MKQFFIGGASFFVVQQIFEFVFNYTVNDKLRDLFHLVVGGTERYVQKKYGRFKARFDKVSAEVRDHLAKSEKAAKDYVDRKL